MEQQDYLKRQIEQIGLVLGGLLNLLRGRRPDDGMTMVTQACEELKTELDIDIYEYLNHSASEIIDMLTAKGFDYVQLLNFSSLLNSMADALPSGDFRKGKVHALSSEISARTQEKNHVYLPYDFR